ncbi:MAG TPA: hypothetical protein DCE58_01985 [Cryomorphaceae bacterium]|nr:hypothetical protein [Cryomorphaceae bacterium]
MLELYLHPMGPEFQKLQGQVKLITPRRLLTTAARIALAGALALFLSPQSPWVMTLFYVYAGFNVLVILGFYLFGRFMQKKLGQMAQHMSGMQGMHGAQDEDLGEAEVVEDAQIEK